MKPTSIPVYKFALRADLTEQKHFLPAKGSTLATGWDVKAAFNDKASLVLRAGSYAKIPLGIRGFCPEGWWYELRPRSSSFGKKNLHCLYGVIDEDYEGQLIFACQYLPDINAFGKDLTIEFGEAIGQIIPIRRQEMIVEEVSNEEYTKLCETRSGNRGAGGFGSTDEKRK